MTDPRPNRRFQFSIRKMLLWTAAVAVLLGTIRTVGTGPTDMAVICSFIGVVAILRMALGAAFAPRVANVVAGIVGAIVAALLVGVFAVLSFTSKGPSDLFLAKIPPSVALVFGYVVGYGGPQLLSGVSSAVNWADNLVRRKIDK